VVLWSLTPKEIHGKVGMSWLVSVGIAFVWSGLFRCPRCGQYFRLGAPYFKNFTRKCLNCRLRAGEIPRADPAPTPSA